MREGGCGGKPSSVEAPGGVLDTPPLLPHCTPPLTRLSGLLSANTAYVLEWGRTGPAERASRARKGGRATTFATSVVWVDATGQRTITRVNTTTGLTFLSYMQAAMKGNYAQSWESVVTNNATPTTNTGAYQSVADRAALLFNCVDGTVVTLVLVSPTLACFMADGETIDPTSTPIAALVANAIGVLTNQSGSPATAFIAGYLLPRTRTPL